MVIFADTGFAKADWRPTNLRLCQRGEWNVRMVVETVLSMLIYICHFKQMAHKNWLYFETRVGFTLALFNILIPVARLPTRSNRLCPSFHRRIQPLTTGAKGYVLIDLLWC